MGAITAIVGVFSSVHQYKVQEQQAEEQEKQNQLTQQRYLQQYAMQTQQLAEKSNEQNESAAKQQDEFSLDTARKVATAKVQSEATGIAGNTEQGLLRDIERQNDVRTSDSKRSNFYNNLQISNQMRANGFTLSNQMASIPDVQHPSKTGAVLGALGSIAQGGATAYSGMKADGYFPAKKQAIQ